MQATLMGEVSQWVGYGSGKEGWLCEKFPLVCQAVVSRPSSPPESASSFDLLSFIFPRALELLLVRARVEILESGSTKW